MWDNGDHVYEETEACVQMAGCKGAISACVAEAYARVTSLMSLLPTVLLIKLLDATDCMKQMAAKVVSFFYYRRVVMFCRGVVIAIVISFLLNCMRIGEAANLEQKIDNLRFFKFCHLRGI